MELRRRRELKGMTQAEFAKEAGYAPKYVSLVELGKNNAGPRYLREAARIFDCTIDDITNGVIPDRRICTPAAPTTAGQSEAGAA